MSATPARTASPSQAVLLSSSTAQDTMATSIPTFAFATISTLQACADATIRWNYTGPDEELSLFVSSASASPPPGAPSLIAFPLSATSQSWTWSPVNVTPGAYEMTAVGLGFANVSSPFQVFAGPSSSCLTAPIPSSTSPTRSRVGVIVGGALGGVAFVVAALGACIYFVLRCSSVPGYRWRSFKSCVTRARPAEWSGLSSHVSIPMQEQRPPGEQAVALRQKEASTMPLELLPRLEPNRRKPSVASVTLLSTAPQSASAPPPSLPPNTTTTNPRVRLDHELPLPLPPMAYTPTVESIRSSRLTRSHTLATTSESTSVVWLRRHALASFTQPHSPTRAGSAAPSSPASQLYKPRESVWGGTVRGLEGVQRPA